MSSTLYIILLLTGLGTFVVSEDYCPGFTDKVWASRDKRHPCCAQADCPSYAICCVQPCGNVCRPKNDKPVRTPFGHGTEWELNEFR
uniref:Secretory peptide n=1 Tax=Heteropoda venatoria TaxID=152925 RepID=A0A088BPP8_HETVE|nr:secretory peptide [Heteropoda venatoria]